MALGAIVAGRLRGGTGHDSAFAVAGGIRAAVRAGLAASPIASDSRFSAVARWASTGDQASLVFKDLGPVRSVVRARLGGSAPTGDTALASATGRYAQQPETGLVYRDTAPARTIVGLQPRGAPSHHPVSVSQTPAVEPAGESARFAKTPAPAHELVPNLYPDSKRLSASLGMVGTPSGLEIR